MNWFYPETPEEAAALLKDRRGLLVAGATDILPNMRNRNLSGGFPVPGLRGYDAYIDISSIAALKQIEVSGELLKIGSAVTHSRLALDPLIISHAPLLAAAAGVVGSPQVRNRGTLGGNIITLASCADTVPALAVHDGRLNFYRAGGGFRDVAVKDYLDDPSSRRMEGEELLVDVHIPLSRSGGWCYHFEKIARREAAAKSRMSLACGLEISGGLITGARIALGAVTSAPRRFVRAEALLTGQKPEAPLFAAAGEDLAAEIQELSGMHSSFIYKLPVIKDLLVRIFLELTSGAAGKTRVKVTKE
ncbi:MAG: FAD binding domain-containing protein [Treponema sp.]|jgi:CO/xanthine dehydrogenase FAD-binding subunit|nr:FAD binding domain-containing protein [Treponema sp.]